MIILVAALVLYIVLFLFASYSSKAAPSTCEKEQSDTNYTNPAKDNNANNPHTDNNATKQRFLENNSDFVDLIISSILCSHNPELSWLLEKETSEQNAIRSVFLGYNDIYCFIGTPLEPAFKTDYNFPWPNTFWIMNGGQTTIRYKYQRFTHADHLGFAPISNYLGISKQTVLGWIAEDVRTRFHSLHPELNVSKVNYSIQEPNCYYYFTFNAAGKILSGWK